MAGTQQVYDVQLFVFCDQNKRKKKAFKKLLQAKLPFALKARIRICNFMEERLPNVRQIARTYVKNSNY